MNVNTYLIFATKGGMVKKTALEEYTQIRKSGLVAINLKPKDQLLAVKPSTGKDEVMLITTGGKAIRFSEKEIRVTARASQGVIGLKLRKGDEVVGTEIISKKKAKPDQLLVVAENGYGKRTELGQYSSQKRGGRGIYTSQVTKRTGKLVESRKVASDSKKDLLLISENGKVIRLPMKDIPSLSRQTQGVRLIRLEKGDQVAALALL